MARQPGEGKYAVVEREQKWRVRELPGDLTRPIAITDSYLEGTRLRLRKMVGDGETTYKLAQKVRRDEQQSEFVKITNMYLSVDEFERLRELPGHTLQKIRWHLIEDATTYAIDVFQGRCQGLVLAECELTEDEERRPVPTFATRDVTDDDRYSGGWLAGALGDDLRGLLAE